MMARDAGVAAGGVKASNQTAFVGYAHSHSYTLVPPVPGLHEALAPVAGIRSHP